MPLSRFRFAVRVAGTACLLAAAVTRAQPADAGPQVMGWIPAYGIEPAARMLESTPAIGHALTRIGLQFWNPSVDGKGLVFAPVDATGKPVGVRDVLRMTRWARAHGVQPLLTVYNNSQVIDHWDWPLARRAFADHPDDFIAALLAAVDTYKLDGVDVDLEGEGDFSADRPAYAAFIHALSGALKGRGKLLTVDSFHSPCDNAPNMRWWSDWVGDVVAVHSMGYADLYEGNMRPFTPEGRPVCEGGAAVFRYSWQIDYGVRAGYRRDQIVMGMPTWIDTWGSGGQGATVVDHLHEARALGAGVALWDLQLAAPGWRKPATWAAVQDLRRPSVAIARRARRRDEPGAPRATFATLRTPSPRPATN